MTIYYIKTIIKQSIIKPLWKFLKKYVVEYVFYQNINLDVNNLQQKKVLVSYITHSIYDGKLGGNHTNINETIQILHTFISKGYSVDLIHCQDIENMNVLKQKKYDIIFGFGDPFYEACLLNHDAIKIIYLTELSPRFSLQQEQDRINYFFERHGVKIPIQRSGKYFKEKHLSVATYGILMGNGYTMKTYRGNFKKIFLLKPTGLLNLNYKFFERNVEQTKKNFIWFGSAGAIHKGLDIAVDAIGNLPGCILYICGLDRTEKKNLAYLAKYNNVIDLGFINIYDESFLNLVNNCSYVILPSCSEGMATSVLTCMNHSLVPLVTKETGIDVFDFGIVLDNYRVEYVREIITKASTVDNDQIKMMHKKVYEYASDNFNLVRFTNEFNDIIDNILKPE